MDSWILRTWGRIVAWCEDGGWLCDGRTSSQLCKVNIKYNGDGMNSWLPSAFSTETYLHRKFRRWLGIINKTFLFGLCLLNRQRFRLLSEFLFVHCDATNEQIISILRQVSVTHISTQFNVFMNVMLYDVVRKYWYLYYPSSRVQTRPKPSEFSGRKNPQHAFLRRGSKAVGLMS